MVRNRGLVFLLVATFVSFACGAGTSGSSARGTIKIGSDLPICTSGGLTTQNGIKFAIDQRNAAGGVEGVVRGPDSADPPGFGPVLYGVSPGPPGFGPGVPIELPPDGLACCAQTGAENASAATTATPVKN